MSANISTKIENYTGKFANLIVSTTYESLPEEAITRAKGSIMDCLGAAMAGTTEPASKIIIDFVRQIGGNEQCTAIGSGFKTSAPFAALANGLTTHVLEFDDAAGEAWSAHPSTVVFPAVMAICENRGLSGKDMILAYIMGLEAGARVGRAMREGHYEFGYAGGWQNTCTIGSIAACAAASKALKLNPEKTSMALGIAGSLASGLNKANVGTMTKPLHAGHGAQNGVTAALLSEKGFTASQNVLDGQWGFCYMFASGRECHLFKLVDGFASPLDIISPGITFKPFPSCRATHPGIDAILRLKSKYDIKVSEISEIICRTSVHLHEVLKYHQPQNVLQAKFSLEYCIALSLLEGEVRLKHFREDKWLKDDIIQKIMQKIHYEYPQTWETGINAPQEIIIKTGDGKKYIQKVTMPETKGVPENPMTKEELRKKFMECAGTLLPLEKVNRAVQLLENLENLANLSELMELLRTKSR